MKICKSSATSPQDTDGNSEQLMLLSDRRNEGKQTSLHWQYQSLAFVFWQGKTDL